jgi:hypothetical protein
VTEAEHKDGLAAADDESSFQQWLSSRFSSRILESIRPFREPREVCRELDDAVGLRVYRKRFREKIKLWTKYRVKHFRWMERANGPVALAKTDPKRRMPHGETVIEAISRLRAQKDGKTVEAVARREITGMTPSGGRATAENYIYGVLFGPKAFRWPRKEKPQKILSIRELVREAQKAAQLSDTA